MNPSNKTLSPSSKETESKYYIIQVLNMFIAQTIENHGIDFAYAGLSEYLINNNPRGMSRIKNPDGSCNRALLKQLNNQVAKDTILKLSNTTDIDVAIDNIITKTIIDMFVKKTIQRHGASFAHEGLYMYLMCGEINGLSNIKNHDNSYNRCLLQDLDYQKVRTMLLEQEKTNDIISVISNIITKNIVNPEDIKKYQAKKITYEEFMDLFTKCIAQTIQNHGASFAHAGLSEYLNRGYPKGLSKVESSSGLTRSFLCQMDYRLVKKMLLEDYNTTDINQITASLIESIIKNTKDQTITK